MARDHGRIRLDIWADEEWRDLPSNAQWLYMYLCSAPSLNFCGVADWRPARIAAKALELKADDVEYAAAWLEAGEFLVVDRDTEEALVRSWVKHDGLLAVPNMAKAMVKAHGSIGSRVLRAVVVDQLERLKQARPELAGWGHVGTVLRKHSMTVADAIGELPPNPSVNPSGKASLNPSEIRAALQSPYSLLHSPNSDHPADQNSHLTSETRSAS